MAINDANLISGFQDLVGRADDHHEIQLAKANEEQKVYEDINSATNHLLKSLRGLREQAKKDGSVSLKDSTLPQTLHSETTPLLQEMGVLSKDFALITEDMDLEKITPDALANLEDKLQEMKERVHNSHSHLNEKVWKTAHDHSMKLAMLCRIDPLEEVRTMNAHMGQSR